MQYNYRILLHKESEGGFSVTVASLPSCVTYGDDIEETIALTKEAITLYWEELQGRGEEVKGDRDTFKHSLQLQFA